MTTFIETPSFPLPPGIGYISRPRYSVTGAETSGGNEKRNLNWARVLHDFEFNIEHAQTSMQGVMDFYHAMGATAFGFRFKDWNDYRSAAPTIALARTDQPLVLITGSTYQLTKRYTKGALSRDRDIKKPVSGTILIADAGVLKTETTHYTINYATGVVTLLYSPAGSLTWGGEFDVPVRFREEVDWELTFREDGGAFVHAAAIALRELRRAT